MTTEHPWSMVIRTAPTEGPEDDTMFDGTPMTKEEFLDGIRDAAQDLADPHGEFNTMLTEFRQGADEVRAHDSVMADKLVGIVTAFENFGAYLKERSELLTAKTQTGGQI